MDITLSQAVAAAGAIGAAALADFRLRLVTMSKKARVFYVTAAAVVGAAGAALVAAAVDAVK